jgi:hypothetical protein
MRKPAKADEHGPTRGVHPRDESKKRQSLIG